MRLAHACLSLLAIVFSSTAIADEPPQRSCTVHNADGETPTYVTLDASSYPAVSAALEKLGQGDPFANAVPLRAMGDFMQLGFVDLVLPMLAGVCSYDMYAANECKGNAF